MNRMKKQATVLFALIAIMIFNVQSVFAADVAYWKQFLNKAGTTGSSTYSTSSFNMTK